METTENTLQPSRSARKYRKMGIQKIHLQDSIIGSQSVTCFGTYFVKKPTVISQRAVGITGTLPENNPANPRDIMAAQNVWETPNRIVLILKPNTPKIITLRRPTVSEAWALDSNARMRLESLTNLTRRTKGILR